MSMSKETLVCIIGFLVFFTSFLGIPTEYKEWIFIVCGAVLTVVGYQLRRNAFIISLEHEGGGRRGEAFVESEVIEEKAPTHKDSENIL